MSFLNTKKQRDNVNSGYKGNKRLSQSPQSLADGKKLCGLCKQLCCSLYLSSAKKELCFIVSLCSIIKNSIPLCSFFILYLKNMTQENKSRLIKFLWNLASAILAAVGTALGISCAVAQEKTTFVALNYEKFWIRVHK